MASQGRLFYLRGELADALLGLCEIELRPPGAGELDRAAIEAQGELGLADVFQADGEIVGVIGVAGVEVEGLEIRLLRGRPLGLVGVEVAQREVEEGRRLARDQLSQPRFRREGIGSTEQPDEAALRERMSRVELEHL